jgi:hypothetical protein
MANFTFETITAAEASAYQASSDSLVFGSGAARLLGVQFQPSPEQVAISLLGRTVMFGPGLYGETATFGDGGILFVGTPNADAANGGAAGDAMFGGAGADVLNGGDGGDLMQGNQGADTLGGGAGPDTVSGGQDNDLITVGVGADGGNFANGNRGDDTITASDSGDTLLGGQGQDMITGGAGGDLIFGNLGDDTINAGGGADTINGNAGYDVMTSGTGADLFIEEAGSSVIDVQLSDRILDWTPEDRIHLPVSGGYAEVVATPPAPLNPDPYGGMGGYSYAPIDDFTAAQNAAAMALASNAALAIVAAQAGPDVVVFVDSNGDHQADMAIILSNTTLASVDQGNFV